MHSSSRTSPTNEDGLLIPHIDEFPVTNPTADQDALLVFVTGDGSVTRGFYYWDNSVSTPAWAPLSMGTTLASFENGLTTTSGVTRLGGILTQATEIDFGVHDATFNLSSSGNFHVQDNGVNQLTVSGAGSSTFGSDVLWRDGNTVGIVIASLVDDADDGRFRIMENGLTSVDLDANTGFVFNEQGLSRDFRIESDSRNNMILLDASENIVRFGTANPFSDSQNGTVIGGVTVDYVVDFDRGVGATGTAVGIGSVEYLLDLSSETAINNSFSPTTHLNRDLGFSTTARAWDDVFADNFINVSDLREKRNVENLTYGLNEVMQMRPVSYILKQDPFNERKLGLIAQEALQLVPESVKTHDYKLLDESNPNEYSKVEMQRMGMAYNSLIPVLIKATQEQQELIETQQKEINDLKALVQQMLEKQ
ncbi:MAG: tail fiber domain-containing protein [Nonlabens sp.]|uniref:tail fiber domain-containing protein n=1 Tax=Nonlabens sp. TaxID=1888209 RepID=UPI003EF2BD07